MVRTDGFRELIYDSLVLFASWPSGAIAYFLSAALYSHPLPSSSLPPLPLLSLTFPSALRLSANTFSVFPFLLFFLIFSLFHLCLLLFSFILLPIPLFSSFRSSIDSLSFSSSSF